MNSLCISFRSTEIGHQSLKEWTAISDVDRRVTWLLGCAAEIAIEDGSEFIDATIVERVSERLRIDPA